MLFDASLRKELSRSFLGTVTVLLTVVVTLMLVRSLRMASRGAVGPSDIMLVMGYTVLGYLPIVLSLSMFVAIIGTLARMYRDSEMVVWFASGRGLSGFIAPLARFALPIVLAIGGLSLVSWPWSQAQVLELRHQFQQRSDLDRIAPGEFQVSSSGDSVFFVDRDSSSLEHAQQIFFAQEKVDSSAVTTARQASLVQQQGQTWVVLDTGQRIEQLRGDEPALRVADFERYEVLLHQEPIGTAETSVQTTPTLELLAQPGDPAAQAELAWRIGLILSAINYVLLALALTSGNPRSGRAGHLVTALLVFIIYFNLLSLGESWVARGVVAGGLWLALLHGGIFLLAAAWLAMRNAQWSLRRLWPGRRAAA